MNKQRSKLLKEAAYCIKRAEFKKQSAFKGKNIVKALEGAKQVGKTIGEGSQQVGKAISEGASEAAKKSYEYAGKLWNRFRGNTPKEIQEVPKEIEPSTPKLESWQHPAQTVSDVPYNYPKRIPDLELFVPYWGEWRKFPVPDYMQGWSPEEAKYYSKLREFETAPDAAYNKLVSLPINSFGFSEVAGTEKSFPLVPEYVLDTTYDKLPINSRMRIPGLSGEDIDHSAWNAARHVRRRILDGLLAAAERRGGPLVDEILNDPGETYPTLDEFINTWRTPLPEKYDRFYPDAYSLRQLRDHVIGAYRPADNGLPEGVYTQEVRRNEDALPASYWSDLLEEINKRSKQ